MNKSPMEVRLNQLAGSYECETQHPERKFNENDYKYRDFEAGFKAALNLPEVKQLVEALESYADGRAFDFSRSTRGEVMFDSLLSQSTAKEALKSWREFRGNL